MEFRWDSKLYQGIPWTNPGVPWRFYWCFHWGAAVGQVKRLIRTHDAKKNLLIEAQAVLVARIVDTFPHHPQALGTSAPQSQIFDWVYQVKPQSFWGCQRRYLLCVYISHSKRQWMERFARNIHWQEYSGRGDKAWRAVREKTEY